MSLPTDNFKPEDYLAVCIEIEKALKNNKTITVANKDSAWWRSMMSRSYYSAFLCLKYAFLSNSDLNRLITNTPEDHKIIAEKLDSLPPTLLYFATYFRNLRKNRNKSDYHLSPRFVSTLILAETSNKKAEEIISHAQIIVQNIP